MRAVSGIKMLIVLQLLLYFVICSHSELCATYYTGKNNKGTALHVKKNKVHKETVNNVMKVSVQGKCMFFMNNKVYGPGDNIVADNIGRGDMECCCEFYDNDNERFLNRHQLTRIADKDQDFNNEMKRRCIPTNGRPDNSFVLDPEKKLRICGQTENIYCISKEKFTVYNVARNWEGYYNDKADIINEAQIVVKCEKSEGSNAILPVHLKCVIPSNKPCNVKYHECN